MAQEFDFIIVGAGSAGCVLANRLSARGDRVLLIEAGGTDWNPMFHIPLLTGTLLRGRYANWAYETEPEPALNNRRIRWPRGKVLGGSSSINGMVYIRGQAADFDSWAQTGLRGWSYADVLPYFRKSETFERDSEFHGKAGELPVTMPPARDPLSEAFIQAALAAGHKPTDDFNGASQEGAGRYDFTIKYGKRWSSAKSFLDPARARPNLTVMTKALVHRVLIENSRAVGVELSRGGAVETIRAAREVIVSGGAINSPQILMLSGIGDPDQLRRHEIEVTADLPGVGRNLQDHLLLRVEHACTQPITLARLMRTDRMAVALLRAWFLGTGPAARFPLDVGLFFRSDAALDLPDLQSHFLPGLSSMTLRLPGMAARRTEHGFMANLCQLRPESRGELTLASADPRAKPVIRANYLSATRDRQVMRAGVRALREVFRQKPFDPYRGPEISPGPAAQSDADLDRWMAATADTVFHPVGTCKMGLGRDAVVDGALRVHGVTGLRVVDASVMPTLTSGNTHAPTVMIAEKAADAILSA